MLSCAHEYSASTAFHVSPRVRMGNRNSLPDIRWPSPRRQRSAILRSVMSVRNSLRVGTMHRRPIPHREGAGCDRDSQFLRNRQQRSVVASRLQGSRAEYPIGPSDFERTPSASDRNPSPVRAFRRRGCSVVENRVTSRRARVRPLDNRIGDYRQFSCWKSHLLQRVPHSVGWSNDTFRQVDRLIGIKSRFRYRESSPDCIRTLTQSRPSQPSHGGSHDRRKIRALHERYHPVRTFPPKDSRKTYRAQERVMEFLHGTPERRRTQVCDLSPIIVRRT